MTKQPRAKQMLRMPLGGTNRRFQNVLCLKCKETNNWPKSLPPCPRRTMPHFLLVLTSLLWQTRRPSLPVNDSPEMIQRANQQRAVDSCVQPPVLFKIAMTPESSRTTLRTSSKRCGNLRPWSGTNHPATNREDNRPCSRISCLFKENETANNGQCTGSSRTHTNRDATRCQDTMAGVLQIPC